MYDNKQQSPNLRMPIESNKKLLWLRQHLLPKMYDYIQSSMVGQKN